jgi:hypothetical protein
VTTFRIALAALVALAAGAASAQNPPAIPPGAMGIPGAAGVTTVPQVELTEKSAKGAIDAYLAIKDKYGDEAPEPKTTAEGYAALDGVNAIVAGQGFSNTGQWHTALTSVAIAYGFVKDGKTGDEIDASLAKIKDNPQIPENLKQQMIAMIAGVRPSQNNLAVVKSLMDDGSYASKLARISE